MKTGKYVSAAFAFIYLVFFVLVVIPESAKREAHRQHVVDQWNREHGYLP